MAIERPNKKALDDALDIYRDAMRPFIIRGLKRVRGKKVEDWIRAALRDDQSNQFEQNVKDGRSLEEAIDINHFPAIVKTYWADVFRDVFNSCNEVKGVLFNISKARNVAVHPRGEDLELEYALVCMDDMAKVLTDINEPDQSKAVLNVKERLEPLKTPAHKLRQGGRNVYAFTLNFEALNNLLPDRVDDEVIKDANRRLTPSHAKNIQTYLTEKDDWLLGPLLLGVRENAVDFDPYTEDETVGTLTVSKADAANMKMFDGQHRRRAIKDVIEGLSQSPRYARKIATLKEASLPIMLYVESNISKLRQMFADASQTKPIEANTVVRFDQRNALNLAALEVEQSSYLFNGRVEMERPSVARHSHNIIAINQLAAALKASEIGYGGRTSKDRNDLYMLDLDSLYERCLLWADDFMPAARDEYNDLMNGEIDNSEIPSKRNETMTFNAAVIRIIAGCYYEWVKEGDDSKALADFLRTASFQPGVHEDSLLLDAGLVAPGGTSPLAQSKLVVNGIDYIVNRVEEVMMDIEPGRSNGTEKRVTARQLKRSVRAQGDKTIIEEYQRLEKYRDATRKHGPEWNDRDASINKFLEQWWEGTGPFQPGGRFHGYARADT